MARVVFEGVSKTYPDGTWAVRELDLAVADGELLCLLGPSGCGKSSTIRMLAGLESVSQGTIRADSRRIDRLPPQARDCAMVFESYALYPHLSAFDNIAMPLRARGVARAEIERRVLDVARLLRIEPLLRRRPGQLSGGQRQRVGIGRALVREPAMFLMDEPLGHLEAYLRVELRAEIRRLQERLGITTVYVTHDQEEAAAIADRIVVMAGGRLQQAGSFLDLLDRPVNRFVAEFVGEPPMAFLPAERTGERAIAIGGVPLALPESLAGALAGHAGADLTLGVRPEDVALAEPAPGRLAGQVVLLQPQGGHSIVTVRLGIGQIAAIVPDARRPAEGEQVAIDLGRSRLHLFDGAGNALLHGRGGHALG
jgi:multiple sugar transport system ATP-binding protein